MTTTKEAWPDSGPADGSSATVEPGANEGVLNGAPFASDGLTFGGPSDSLESDGPELPPEQGLDRLSQRVEKRFGAESAELVRRAFNLSEAAHRDQRRVSGELYITHPLAVADIVAKLGLDPATIAAALLHDVVEDTDIDRSTLEQAFGTEVARLVDGVTKISAIEAREKEALKARSEDDSRGKSSLESENIRRMLLAACDDLRVILIKLSDRLHNMRTLEALSADRRLRMANETLEIYAPLANRLGIWQLKSEFEDLALREIDPETYAKIQSELAERRSQHEAYVEGVIAQLRERLAAADIEADISGRTKHIYSIYRKMQLKDLSADEVYDVLAVRVIVNEINQCYLALGIVHAMWPPLPGGFDDYIAKQKNNLYQSLHTAVYGPGNRPLEIQIRTDEMHEVAEYGVAAHWLYKESTPRAREIEEKISALRRLLKTHSDESSDADAFVEGLKTDVFRDQVYVFTPKGDVIELPAGSTPVDFAYHIHTEVGHRCRGAIVNGKMVPLDYQVGTGQTVRIVTAKGEVGPSRDWLNPALGYVASNRARSKIKQWFRRQAKAAAVREGREVVERQLRKLGLTKMSLEDVALGFDYDRLEEFLAAVGRHEIPSESIGARLLEAEVEQQRGPAAETRRAPPTEPTPPRPEKQHATGVTMRGADDVFTRVARCCTPVPGEQVIGYITRGRGVTLHRTDCPNVAHRRETEPGRFIRVDWQQSDQQSYPVELRITAYDRPGLVRDISDVIARRGVNMSSIAARAAEDGAALVTSIVHITSSRSLSGLIDKIATIDNVIEVRRAAG